MDRPWISKGAMKALGMGKGLQLCGLMSGTSLNIEKFLYKCDSEQFEDFAR